MRLSIIIPALNEQSKIQQDILAAEAFLRKQQIDAEIIVVDDGSSDETAKAARTTQITSETALRVLQHEQNFGKGMAVRTGMLASQGEFVLFADAGLTIPFAHCLRGIEKLELRQCEIAHGSRRLPDSRILRPFPLQRRIISSAFLNYAKARFQLPKHLTDTQCGFKVYRGDIARNLFRDCRLTGFLFEIEIILRATRAGLHIEEFPVDWTCDPDSRLSLTRTPKFILRELRQLRKMRLLRASS